ncbi:MAG: hypothetical protein U9N00_01355, partial [Candidatus Bipolaricaulota bacterium]|nr:hypothetical protein [Candidatus Bipolaricaulota bacterium]
IAWVQTPSIDQQQFIDEATQVVKDVFSFWDLPIPVPALDWATPMQTSSQARYDALLSVLTQTPSLILEGMDPLAPGYGAYYKVNGSPFPLADSDELLIVPAPAWGDTKILPLLIGLFPDTETMNRLYDDYTFSGRFGGVDRYTLSRLEGTGQEEKYNIFRVFYETETIVLSPQGNWQHILRHELAHWAYWLWGSKNQVYLFNLPKMVAEGFADYTACTLSGRDTWRSVAAIWSQEGDLTDVPWPLLYEIGTSIVNLLVQEKGKDGFLEMLVDPTVDWDKVISSLTPAWRESLADAKLSSGDLARYEATLEALDLCRRMLAPVLSSEAAEIIDQLSDGQGTMADIDRFWDLVSQTPPEPSEEDWQALIARIPTFRIIQYQDSDPDIRMVRARVEINLDKYGGERDWRNFYLWFIKGLRDVIAHYGSLPITSETR